MLGCITKTCPKWTELTVGSQMISGNELPGIGYYFGTRIPKPINVNVNLADSLVLTFSYLLVRYYVKDVIC